MPSAGTASRDPSEPLARWPRDSSSREVAASGSGRTRSAATAAAQSSAPTPSLPPLPAPPARRPATVTQRAHGGAHRRAWYRGGGVAGRLRRAAAACRRQNERRQGGEGQAARQARARLRQRTAHHRSSLACGGKGPGANRWAVRAQHAFASAVLQQASSKAQEPERAGNPREGRAIPREGREPPKRWQATGARLLEHVLGDALDLLFAEAPRPRRHRALAVLNLAAAGRGRVGRADAGGQTR